MDILKVEKSLPSTSVYNNLHDVESLSHSKVPSRSMSTISFMNSHQMENPLVKQPTVSLVLPPSMTESSIEQTKTFDDTKKSSLIQFNEQENKEDENLLLEGSNDSCICWIFHKLIRLICMALFTCLIGMFIFTLIFYAFDIYWLEQPIINNSSWWWWFNDNNNSNTNFTRFDSDMISITQTINYDDDY
ncbi:unnamed protein product [Rotaria sordida]|uniref:Uncharacterized protein n=2 Tax=Rotaria sordida TaxID=392033 RepID=A0A814KSF8_9BILA|nr:unnamed protein product [Rotaria sordida]